MNDFLIRQPQLASQKIQGRYVTHKSIDSFVKHFPFKTIGTSTKSHPIHSIDMGSGSVKVLIWSQMHGNESTATKALMDALCYLQQNPSFLAAFTLKVIPILNPDGAEAYTRVNANDVDLNRDAINQSQLESKLLVDVYKSFKPDYCFNLHDQRTIFGVNDNPCMLSFLSPAADETKKHTTARKKAMGVIGYIQNALQEHIPNQVGRYDDTFNQNCMGDFFTQQGTPTLLFEAGQVGEDYGRVETRKWYGFSILKAFECIALSLHMPSIYQDIPGVEKSFVDVLIKNITLDNIPIDIALQYVEVLKNEEIHFVPIVHKIGKLAGLNGHKIINVTGKNISLSKALTVGTSAIELSELLNLTQYSH